MNAKGRPLPKFGEWDVNNPASAEGFTVIFNKARDQKKTNGIALGAQQRFNDNLNQVDNHHKQDHEHNHKYKKSNNQQRGTRKWLCCFYAT
ncbi:unnamed protein product [Amaranthus hypochondriacus]